MFLASVSSFCANAIYKCEIYREYVSKSFLFLFTDIAILANAFYEF